MTTFPDSMFDIRAWLRSNATLNPLHGGRCFFRLPDSPSAAPFIRIYRSGGSVQAGETPVQDLRISHEIWGKANADYAAVRQLAIALEAVYFDVQSPTILSGSTVLLNAATNAVIDVPDSDTGWPRITLDAILTVRHI